MSILVLFSGNLFLFSASAEPQAESIPISAENFPDSIFREYVLDTFDADKDALLSQEEIGSVTSVFVRLKGIQDLKGIEYFTNLKYLNAELNHLKTLDISKNTKLESVIVANNRLTSIKLPNDNRNDTLVYLDVFSNSLQELDVHNLFALGFIHADDNALTTLDLSDCPLKDGHGFVAMNNYLESITLPNNGMQYPWKEFLMTQHFPKGKETGYKVQWYTDPLLQNAIDPETTETILCEGQTIYAQYVPIRYSIVFDPGSESVTGNMENMVLDYGQTVELTENAYQPVNPEIEFAGWQSNKGKTYGDGQAISNLTDKDGEVIRLTAKWKDKNFDGQPYQIVLKDGTSSEEQQGQYGVASNITQPSFTKEHYHLVGWSLREGGPVALPVNASLLFGKPSEINGGVLTLYAVWEKDRYTVQFEDAPSYIPSVTVEYGETISLPQSAIPGYTFEGWYTQQTGGEKWQNGNPVTGAMTLYARFAPIQYQVQFDGNGADNLTAMELSGMTVSYDEIANLPKNLYEREYYTFKGWSRQKQGSVQYLDKGQIASLTQRDGEIVTLYAVWERNQVQVTASVGGKTTQFSMNQGDLLTLATPVKKGYVFQGWLNGDTDQIWDMAAPVTGELNLVAQFAPIRYQVILDGNGADNPQAMEGVSLDAVYDQKGALPQNLFTKEYHTFVGWSREKNGEAQFHDQAEIFNLTDVSEGTVRLYAVWKRETAAVVLHDGSGATYEIQVGKGLPLPESTQLSRPGYRFEGWFTSPDFGPASVFELDEPVTGSLSLYAKWSLATYTITFGNSEMEPISYTIQDTVSLPQPSREGYEFAGWRDEAGNLLPMELQNWYGDLRLTAVWKKIASETPSETPSEVPSVKPSEEDTTGSSPSPQTGEARNTAFWLGGMLIAAAGAWGAVWASRKKSKKV